MAKAIPTPHYAKVFCARKTLRVLRAQKTFVYSRNVKRHFCLISSNVWVKMTHLAGNNDPKTLVFLLFPVFRE
jgi:hypothetical protein